MLQILFSLLSVLCKEKVQKEELYLISPYVNSKGVSAVARFLDDFCIRSHGKNSQFIQLGYSSSGSTGALMYKNKIENTQFNIDVKLSILDNNSKYSGMGMMFFISKTDAHEKGGFYGKEPNFDGLCICIDTSNISEPFVTASSGKIDGHSKKLQENRKYIDLSGNDKLHFRIVQVNNTLEVFLNDGHNEIKIYSTKRNLIEEGSFIGACALNGHNGGYSYMINSIEVSYLQGGCKGEF